ncbi:thioredoxin-like domain-containing protein [Gracilimonas sediminicola]|uniref:Thioredoxin-like domain-containing protein n=1 Tax=Gracilimonas sediminicola TaxID=2952158 RepID=A0A9X2RF47_9BACT|nr:thioredoxin-like domain-containing protein [Gracilimonas sediminicola]MCP9290159.1 thioredoxin-like domain-containing protein [Gracilimonas sediminicola]
MKTYLTLFFLLLSTSAFAQEQLTVFYFGASDCGPCNRPDVIESIDKIRANFDSQHTNYDTKLVMVAMDEDIDTGLKYISKYDEWDEISIGSRYHNENTLAHLNNIMIPGVPHIIIFKDTFEVGDYGVEIIKNRELVKNILSGEEIVSWVDGEMKLD